MNLTISVARMNKVTQFVTFTHMALTSRLADFGTIHNEKQLVGFLTTSVTSAADRRQMVNFQPAVHAVATSMRKKNCVDYSRDGNETPPQSIFGHDRSSKIHAGSVRELPNPKRSCTSSTFSRFDWQTCLESKFSNNLGMMRWMPDWRNGPAQPGLKHHCMERHAIVSTYCWRSS